MKTSIVIILCLLLTGCSGMRTRKAKRAASAALMSMSNGFNKKTVDPIQCNSRYVGNEIYTECK